MRRLLRRVWYLIRQSQIDADLAEEMELHRELKQREMEDQGSEPTVASRASRRAFGSRALAANRSRDVWIAPWLQDAVKDLQFAARLLARDRRFTFVAVVALALGIAANTTIFTFINTALFKDLPFDEPRQIMAVSTVDERGPLPDAPGPRRDGASYTDFLDWRAATRTFTGLAADTGGTMNLSDDTRAPERFRGSYVSGNLFDIVRVKAAVGRGFLPDDDKPGATPTVVLGYDVWQSRYGGDPAVIGRTVKINDVPSIVIGVMPRRFRFPMTAEIWQPIHLLPAVIGARRDARSLNVTGRLADDMFFAGDDPLGRWIELTNPAVPGAKPLRVQIVGVSPTVRQQFLAEIDPVVFLPFRTNPTPNAMLMIRGREDVSALSPIVRAELRALDADLPVGQVTPVDEFMGQSRWGHRVFGTMFSLFAMIALAVSALGLYAVTAYSVTQRTHEIGVRVALGASAHHVVWLFARRGLLPLFIGVAIGLGGAFGVGRLVQNMLVRTSPTDPITFGAIVALLATVSVLACFWPARRAARLDPVAALRHE